MKKFANCIIADCDLETYLADKLTIRPDYEAHGVSVEIKTNYAEIQRRMAEERRKSNKAVTRNYGLKK